MPVNSGKWISAPLGWGDSPARSEHPGFFFSGRAGRAQLGVINPIKPKINIYKLNPKESKHSMDSRSPGITQFEQRAGHNLKKSRLAQPRAGDNPAGKRTAEGNKNINNQSRKNPARHNCNEHNPPLPRRGKRRICLCESAVSAQQKLLLGPS